jgi:hypothetical protein
MLYVVEVLAGIQQGLGGYTTHVQAGASRRRFAVFSGKSVDAGSFHSQLSGADGGYVPAGPAANNDDIKFV